MWNLADITFALIHYRLRWMIPTLAVALIALIYAAMKPSEWEATQAVVLRDEAVSTLGKPGEFIRVEDMKHAQETVLQVARSREVIEAALAQLGPPSNRWSTESWPNKDDISAAREAINVHSPSGTEFGTTEVLYITVDADTPERSAEFNRLICAELDTHLGKMRNDRALSLVDELSYREHQAVRALEDVTKRLSETESEVGTDLAELRILNEVGSGNGNLREQMVQIKSELRGAMSKRQNSEQLLEILTAAQKNPNELVATPNQLLESQPALRRLKEGLIDAQLQTAQLQGIRTSNHPGVVAAAHAETEIRDHLHQEIDLAIAGLEAEQTVIDSRIDQLQGMLDDVSGRMTKLASLRAGYNNLVSEVKEKNEKLTKLRTDLADARSSVQTSTTTSLVTKVGTPEVSDYPIGPSRKVIAGMGLIGGLGLGLGVLFLTLPWGDAPHSSLPPAESVSGYGNGNEAAQTTPAASGHGLSLKQALAHLSQRPPSRN
ncbi:Wzz/FepE/Etk N-terminal domain-containing protein [Blastopirellula marina]|uniref:Polysaccharide chain length determinant N-terminal domain-containing protein n=1 Tax=Blastopirellula marina TaxID=124 RepID=A0A2S8GMA4_9BACT|nr:Wzz/FepE/Etk N-terminal domain-containing protein [Blastopirellula marina]PQO45552.1 hypothetical protein C5Y93_14005 [Blastopirellula marina]